MSNLGSMMAGGNPTAGRQEDDFYATPPEVTQALLRVEKFDGVIWDCASGDGAILKVCKDNGYTNLLGSDINPRGIGKKLDFLTIRPRLFDVNIVTNPPFNLAKDFIEKAHSLNPRSISMVLKSSYWHAKSRKALFDKYPPHTVYPLLWRPDFLGLGRPTMEIMWCVWRRGITGKTIYQPLEK
jgi:hypothetical protein